MAGQDLKMKKHNTTKPSDTAPHTSGTITLNPPDTTQFRREPVSLPAAKPAFPVSPADARALADDNHGDALPALLDIAAGAIRQAAARGAYSTTVPAKEPLLSTLADRLSRAGYATRILAQGVSVQWS